MQYLAYKESRPRGSFGYPVELYQLNPAHPQYHMPLHWHGEVEIIRLLAGRFDCTVGGETYQLRPGDLLFINSGLLHTGSPTRAIYDCLVFDLSWLASEAGVLQQLLKPLEQQLLQVKPYWPAQTESDASSAELRKAIDLAFEEARGQKPAYQLMVRAALSQAWGLILRERLTRPAPVSATGSRRQLQQIKAVLSLIEKQYQQDLSLAQLAAAAGMNSRYFCRFFYRMTGHTPIDYLNDHRIEAACCLLLSSDQTVTQIASACGFRDASYFIRVFKKYKKVSPRAYRRQAAAAAAGS
ncbi:AraC family transcriptional regulator [Oscillospiraceae bacterium HV4-5-C5C]|nr:AraC family transcriptional regulator [Oscillospiraceae bacterium HV4-5-C5C]